MKRLFILLMALTASFSFAEKRISDFTDEKARDFVTLRVPLKSEEDDAAIAQIKELQEGVFKELEAHALDLEQEKLILEAMYFMEVYQHSINKVEVLEKSDKKKAAIERAALREQMKDCMKRMETCLDERNEEQVSEWLYMFLADVTSFYMTRSVAATLLRGLSVRDNYRKAVEVNPQMASAWVSLGNWYFYAPFFVGGGKKNAQKCYDKAVEVARFQGEEYVAYLSYSQLAFEKEEFDVCEEYIEKLIDLDLGRKEIDIILRCNKKGYSFFQYLRDRVGIDEELSEEEKTEED
ncbi:MAG: TRAP transporter TatT component family protein [Treponema sp.]|nr:TRAP transporter TatT component family protein [Treponema sp.]